MFGAMAGGIDSGLVGGVLTALFFFCQAEDGIRDYKVTGVQTCALPISNLAAEFRRRGAAAVADPREVLVAGLNDGELLLARVLAQGVSPGAGGVARAGVGPDRKSVV